MGGQVIGLVMFVVWCCGSFYTICESVRVLGLGNFSILFSVASFVHVVFVAARFGRVAYTAEFLPMISPLRECTKRPSNSMVEFCFKLPVGVRSGSFSSL